MTKRRLMSLVLSCFVLLSTTVMTAQSEKYGHVNFGNIMEQMPETQKADRELAEFRDSLLSKHETMVKAFEERYGKYVEKVNQGLISQVERKQTEADLQKEQERILTFEQEIQQKVEQRRQELLDPILQRLNNAIQTVGEEGGYTAIFDTSVGAMLYAEESKNLTGRVIDKLGLDIEETADEQGSGQGK